MQKSDCRLTIADFRSLDSLISAFANNPFRAFFENQKSLIVILKSKTQMQKADYRLTPDPDSYRGSG
jgi:hypothetical protein